MQQAALSILPGGRAPLVQRSPEPEWLHSVCLAFSNQLRDLFPGNGLEGLAAAVAGRLQGIAEIALDPLDREDKVRIDGSRLCVDPGYPRRLWPQPAAERQRRFVLYVVHEVAHIAQGIDDKQRVHELHAAEGEEALLRLDLDADHAAARLGAVYLHEDLVKLKRTQLASLRAFPLGLEHRPAERHRKSRRAASLAVDIAAREREVIGPGEFAELYWPRGGGAALVFAHGAFGRCIHTATVSAREAGVLDGAASWDPQGHGMTRLLRVARGIVPSAGR
jgi:hypothetical protein